MVEITTQLGEVPKARLSKDNYFENGYFNPEFFEDSPEPPEPIGASFVFRQLSGTINVADQAGNATVAEFQSGLESLYSSYGDKARYGDIVTLLNSSGGAFVGRFLVVLNGDGAPGEATIAFTSGGTTFYALNISSTSLASIIDALDQALGIFDSSGTTPRDDDIVPDTDESQAFSISVDGHYDVGADGSLSIGLGNPVISVKGGKYTAFDGISGTFTGSSTNSYAPPLEGGFTYVHIYAKFTINFSGTIGNRVPSSMGETSIDFYTNDNPLGFREGGEFSSDGATYTHNTYIGAVALCRRGNRRWAVINQKIVGDITGFQGNFNSISSGTQTDSDGTDVSDKTKSGMRETILCLNGKPYGTFILTGPLYEIT